MEVMDVETITKNKKLYPYAIAYSVGDQINYSLLTENSCIDLVHIIVNNFVSNTVYYVHNLLFDFTLILDGLVSLNIKFSWVYLNYSLYEVKIRHNNRVIRLCCSYKLIPYPLKRFYPTLSHHQKLFFPYSELESWVPTKSCSLFKNIPIKYHSYTLGEYFRLYAIVDCKILKEGLQVFKKTLIQLGIGFNYSKYTCGGIAMAYYIKMWGQIKLNLPNKVSSVVRQAYYGGRCEVFGNLRVGEKILHFDFTGMYQQCMLTSLPWGDFVYVEGSCDINKPGFYYIEITYYLDIPILPLRDEKLYFKQGRLSGWYWYEEVLLTLKFGDVRDLKVVCGYISLKNDKVLVDFISTLSLIRDGGGLKKDLGKLLINSFYGRLAMNDTMDFFRLTYDGSGDNTLLLNSYFLERYTLKKKPKANIAIAAAITAKARIKLFRGFQEVKKNNGRMLYCDTDSLFAAFPLDEKVENKLLEHGIVFKVENTAKIIDAVFIQPKTYAILLSSGQEIIKIKGVNVEGVSFQEIKTKFYNNEEQIAIGSTIIQKKKICLHTHYQQKLINLLNYDKRRWSDGYKDTTPHTLS